MSAGSLPQENAGRKPVLAEGAPVFGLSLANEARAGGGVLGAAAEAEAKVFRRVIPGTPASALESARTAAAIVGLNNVRPPRPWK